MDSRDNSHPTSSRRWPAIVREVFGSVDFIVAVVVSPLAFYLALNSESVRQNGTGFLGAALGVGVALTAVVAAVLALIVVWFDETYRKVLQATKGGWKGAMRPYKVVAIVSAAVALTALVSMFVWSAAAPWTQALLLALTLGLALWAVIGSVQLIGITFFHGEMRAELLKGIEEARKALARRRSQSQKQAG
jgi:hypothetical protein